MKKITLLSVVLLLFITHFTYSQNSIISKRIKINNPSKSQLLQVKEVGIDLSCGAIFDNNNLILELGENNLNALDQKGINYTVIVEDLIQYAKEKNAIELFFKSFGNSLICKKLKRDKKYTLCLRSSPFQIMSSSQLY